MNSQDLRRKEGTFLTVLNGLERVITAAPVVGEQFVRFVNVCLVVFAVETFVVEVPVLLDEAILLGVRDWLSLPLTEEAGDFFRTSEHF